MPLCNSIKKDAVQRHAILLVWDQIPLTLVTSYSTVIIAFTFVLHFIETGVALNPDGAIVVKNIEPQAWSGRKFNVGIYKEDSILLQDKGLAIGMQVAFIVSPNLYFGVVSNMKTGQSFESLTMTSSLTDFDLTQYPNGIEVTLKEKPGGGEVYFTAEHYM